MIDLYLIYFINIFLRLPTISLISSHIDFEFLILTATLHKTEYILYYKVATYAMCIRFKCIKRFAKKKK